MIWLMKGIDKSSYSWNKAKTILYSRLWTVVIEQSFVNHRFRTVLPVLQNRLFADVSNLQSFQSKDEGNPPWRSGFCRRHFREEFLKKQFFWHFKFIVDILIKVILTTFLLYTLTIFVMAWSLQKTNSFNYFFALHINDTFHGMAFAENKFV